jgi:hypothetical protein
MNREIRSVGEVGDNGSSSIGASTLPLNIAPLGQSIPVNFFRGIFFRVEPGLSADNRFFMATP